MILGNANVTFAVRFHRAWLPTRMTDGSWLWGNNVYTALTDGATGCVLARKRGAVTFVGFDTAVLDPSTQEEA